MGCGVTIMTAGLCAALFASVAFTAGASAPPDEFAIDVLPAVIGSDNNSSVVVKADNVALQYSGRFITHQNGSRTYDWAAFTVLFRVTGVSNLSQISVQVSDSKTNRYAVYQYSHAQSLCLADVVPDGGTRLALLSTNGSVATSYPLVPAGSPAATLDSNASTNLLIYKTTEPNGIWMPFGP
eukprot:Hpha_TRINITY_DN30847_c0_g1::TRINITY_DN30847_c0_g1_i1::g.155694::m.155694